MEEQLIHQLAEALREAVRALNVHPRFKVQETNSYAIASKCDRALSRYDQQHGTGQIDEDQLSLALARRAEEVFSMHNKQ